jgi:ATP-binding cassette subfamily F protein 3
MVSNDNGGVDGLIILQSKDLAKWYGAEKVFENISFIINEGEKVGLVGPNGAGKTTLFRCITGEEPLDSGEIVLGSKSNIGYLQQIPYYPEGTTLLDAVLDSFSDIFVMRDQIRSLEKEMGKVVGSDLEKTMDRYSNLTHEYEQAGGFSCEAKARKIIKGLGFGDEDLNREINKFSGGEKTRAGLARLLVREPDLLLLDEPTNHLDLRALEWLETYLKNYQGAVLLISHDRYFLDEVVTRILELTNQRLKTFPGNYSKFLKLKKEQELAQAKAYEKQQKEIQEIEEYILKYKAGVKSKQARGRASRLARLEKIEKGKSEGSIHLSIGDIKGTGEIVLKAENLRMAYTGKELFSDLSITIYKGEKIALIGGNGTGKSTLLKLIIGKLEPLEGRIYVGSRVKIGYFDQEHQDLNNNHRVIDEIMYTFNFSENEARDKLAQVLFHGDDVFKSVADLSGGEKGRLAILKIILDQPNFLVLDEPTNHLDLASKEVVEDFLINYKGTILLVSHDRYLLDRVTDRTLELDAGTISNYLGNYSYYKWKKLEFSNLKEEKKDKKSKTFSREQEKPKINKSQLKEEIVVLEEKIEAMEAEKEKLSRELADPVTYQNEERSKEKVNEFKRIEEELPLLYDRWEELNINLEKQGRN